MPDVNSDWLHGTWGWLGEVWTSLDPLAGVIVGAGLVFLQDRFKWRRDWTIKRVERREDFYIELLDSMERQHLILGRARAAVEQRGQPVSKEDARQYQREWQTNMVRAGLMLDEGTQSASKKYDEIWGRAAMSLDDATNSERIGQTFDELERARVALLNAINRGVDDLNTAIDGYMLGRWRRRWAGAPPMAKKLAIEQPEPDS